MGEQPITKQGVSDIVRNEQWERLVALFDQNPDRVRRYVTRLSFMPGDEVHAKAIDAFRVLSRERSSSNPKFFLETIRRHIWAMNDEGANDDWSAPEIICAIIAGNPQRFKQFYSYAYNAAIDELMFQPSLLRGSDLLIEHAPEVVDEFRGDIQKLREELAKRNDYLVR